MAGKMYLGVGGVAKKVKKVYLGVGGVAKKVKKVYLGVNGVAKCVLSGGEVGYYGTITPLSLARYKVASAATSNHALFAGGVISGNSSSQSAVVDAYDGSLTRTVPTALSVARRNFNGSHVGNYALFAGGEAGAGSYYGTVDIYDPALTRYMTSNLRKETPYPLGGAIGNYALFAGGSNAGYTTAYDTALTRTYPTGLSYSNSWVPGLPAPNVGNYVLFGGGGAAILSVYDTSLTLTTASAYLSDASMWFSDITGYALFYRNTIGLNAYNSSLTKTDVTVPSVAGTYNGRMIGFGDTAVIFDITANSTNTTAFKIDASLTCTLISLPPVPRYDPGFIQFKDYALLGGGNLNGSDVRDTVNVYIKN